MDGEAEIETARGGKMLRPHVQRSVNLWRAMMNQAVIFHRYSGVCDDSGKRIHVHILNIRTWMVLMSYI